MTSIYDIAYEDIKIFLLANNPRYDYKNEDEAYNIALILLKNKKAIGHTISIIEWMMAHNLLVKNINIPIYTSYEIDNMSQNEVIKLAKILGMNGNNRDNVKNILRYLHKLDDENVTLFPEINDIILQNLNKLEINEINFENLKFNDVINLLKTHRHKALIRKQIYDNMEKIVLYNVFHINAEKLDNLDYVTGLSFKLPSNISIKTSTEREAVEVGFFEPITNVLIFFEAVIAIRDKVFSITELVIL